MTLVGKILVVAILIMSVVFMGFAMAVYSTHTNWKDMVTRSPEEAVGGQEIGLQFQLEQKQKEVEELNAQLAKLDQQVSAILDAEQAQRAKLETKLTEELELRTKFEEDLALLENEKREWDAKWAAAQENLTTLTQQIDQMQKDILAARQERDDYFLKLVGLTDSLHEKHGELVSTKSRQGEMAKKVAIMRQRLMDVGVKDPDVPVVGNPPAIGGLIQAVKDNSLIEISLGSDDGIRVGHTVHVYRSGRAYLGRAQVIRTSTDRAVAKMISGTIQGNIQKGDRVATNLNLG